MKAQVVVSLFVSLAVLKGASCGNGNWTIVSSENLETVEIIDESEEPADSEIPDSELKEAVIFNIFTSSNPDTPEIIYINDDETLAASNFDADKPTRFIFHGWQSSPSESDSATIRDAYIAQGDYNVIAVDWSTYADSAYPLVRAKVVAVGTYVGNMIDYLETQGMNLQDLIIIGHSIGAHVAGIAGRSATNTVASIVAIDPAGPLFYFVDPFARLRSTDGEFVQVIHTNSVRLGYNGELGDVDFWPNGGAWQPGCSWDLWGICSHSRSVDFFVESILNTGTKFIAHSCDSYSNYAASQCFGNSASYMGGPSLDTTASGNYYLTTNAASPYAMG